ncbi:MAG: hypothetical protein J5507_03960 [Clostridia bacterium]|nr:hypothetical protein [Clostridia bacterium]
MNMTKKGLFIKICAVIIVIALTISDFMFVGQAAVSYAVDIIKTNSANVDFSAYFINASGDKIEKLEESIDKGEEYLYVDISVKNEGYFNGKISLSNNNFNIKNMILSENVAEISGNEVRLNQINAGSNVTIKLAIDPINSTSITRDMLNSVTKVNLNGQYINSKNVEKDKHIDISGTAEVSMNWKSSENTKLELESSLLTNSVYTNNNEEKRVVQILVNSKITNNNYPVKNTNIILSVPEKVKDVMVHSRSNAATNSSVKFSDANYIYNREENKLTIKVLNENTENISWTKNVQDSFVVTYILEKEDNLLNSEVNVIGDVVTYDNKELSSTNNVHIDKEIDGIVSFELNTNENYIYKGRLFTGEERSYKTTSKIYIDYLNANKITLNEGISSFASSNATIPANIVYKQIKINKNEFLAIFGNDGYITIKDNNGAIISNINANSGIDTEGNVVVNISEGKEALSIETSNPITIGALNIEATKNILSSGYSREIVSGLTAINENIDGKYDEKQINSLNKKIELRNTSSKASLAVSTNTLSSIEENKQVKITAVLLNNDESKDLYQNPNIKINLPQQVKEINNINCQVLYANGLEAKAEIREENGSKYIEINLSGTQQTYNTETLEGTTIIIYADILVDNLATNSDENIVLNYTNELASSFDDNGEVKVPVKITAEQGLITTNNIKELNITTIGNIESKDAVLDIGSSEKNLTVDFSAINNEDSPIENVEVLGRFPTNSNLGVKLTSQINTTSNAKIYYSDIENATNDLNDISNNWVLNGNIETAKSYLIIIDSMQVGDRFTANYTINIPANLNYNLNASEGYTVNYRKFNNSENKSVKATTINLTTGSGAEISANIKAYVGGEELKDGDTVYTGEVIKYVLNIKNSGTETAKQVTSEFNIPEGSSVVKYVKGIDNPTVSEDGSMLMGSTDYYEKITNQENKIINKIEELSIGEEKQISFELMIDDNKAISNIIENATISYLGKAETTNVVSIKSNTLSNNIETSNISSDLFMLDRKSEILETNTQYYYDLKVKNNTDRAMSNIQVRINTNGIIVKAIYCGEENIPINNNTFTIDSLNGKEQKEYIFDILTPQKAATDFISVKINEMYNSNIVTEIIKNSNIEVSLSSETEGETVKNGDEIAYNIKITNNSDEELEYLEITQSLSTYLDINKVIANQEEIEVNNDYELSEEDKKEHIIGFIYDKPVKKGDVINIKVETLSDEDVLHKDNIQLTSEAIVNVSDKTIKSEQINHILAANEFEEKDIDEPNQGENNNENNDKNNNGGSSNSHSENNGSESNASEENRYTISGTAWLDENEDGKRDPSEKTLGGINVKLLNLDNNVSTTATTSENGFYSISNVANGRYVAIFEYDNEKYVLTKYHAENIPESRNSDVENVNMNIDGENQKVSSTDTLTINNLNLTNIDLGLIEARTFDLSLSKTISSVKISNENGSSNKDYNDTNLAKVEVKAKYLDSTTAVIEYKIKVTNNGELAGYVSKIVDYKPTDLTFNSKLNPDWYQSGDNLYSTALANQKLEAGESKELTLTLTKTMTESNTGLTNNTAEIVEAYNYLGIEDTDSTPANKEAKEDDYGSANVIISVSTGAAVSYISLTLSIIAVIAVGAYIATRKILKENIKI